MIVNEIEDLFLNQIQTWPRLARGIEGLEKAQTRRVRIDWFDVFIRHIPHRVKSTTAAVDPQSIAKRPCFLCPQNLDPEERGIPLGRDYMIYFNPFPIVDRHLTIVHRDHREQRIGGQIEALLDIASALPGYFIIYNGPECGASAPDHMHFQAGLRVLFPIENDTAHVDGVAVHNYARNVFVFRDTDRRNLIEKITKAIELLSSVTFKTLEPPESPDPPEPLINIAAFHDAGNWVVYLFPRGKHRPNVYHTGELTVSPATIDLCGIFVVAFEKDFVRISGEDIAAIYREVTLPDAQFNEVLSKL